jgi:hypothetical protein
LNGSVFKKKKVGVFYRLCRYAKNSSKEEVKDWWDELAQ